jgi:hypothetical protein
MTFQNHNHTYNHLKKLKNVLTTISTMEINDKVMKTQIVAMDITKNKILSMQSAP